MRRLLLLICALSLTQFCIAWDTPWNGRWNGPAWSTDRWDSQVFSTILKPTTLTNVATVEFDLPTSQEQVNVVFDGVPATDNQSLIIEFYAGGSWQTNNYVEHVTLSSSASSNYAGGTSTGNAIAYNVGSDTGESVSTLLTITNHANALYPLVSVDGGLVNNSGDVATACGVIAWKDTTVATKARIKFASGNIESGKIAVYGSTYGAFLPLDKGTPTAISNDSTVDFTLSDSPLYCVSAGAVIPTTDASELYCRFFEGVFTHNRHNIAINSSSASYSAVASTSSGVCSFAGGVGNATGESLAGNWLVPNPASSTLYSPVLTSIASLDSSANVRSSSGVGGYMGGTDALTQFTVLPNTSTIASGAARLRKLVHGDIGPWKLKSIIQANNDDTINFTLGSGVRDIVIGVGVVLSVDNSQTNTRVGTSAGIKTTSYLYHMTLTSAGGTSYFAVASASASVATEAFSSGNDTGENGFFVWSIPNLPSTYRPITVRGSYIITSGATAVHQGCGAWTGGTDPLTTFQLRSSGASDITSGTFYHYALGE